MKIGILGAMSEEISSIQEIMDNKKQTMIAGRIYIEGTICDIPVVLVFSRWGKVASSSTTTTLINKFNVNFVLFTGVAGAVNEDLNIGDIIIGNGLYQHDMDARPFFDQFQIPLTSTIIFKPESHHIEKAKAATEKFINRIHGIFNPLLLEKYSIFKPAIHIGLIASGDKFVSNPTTHNDLSYDTAGYKTLAVEMEGAAVAQICEDYNLPFLVIRIISDKADRKRSINPTYSENFSPGMLRMF